MNTTEMKEVISKRTACMKVFEHADHRFTAAIYGTPVHYMKDGRWEEIDNRLEAAADEVPADADDMENISGAFRVRLSNKVKKKQMVSLGEGSRKLTWGFVDANSVKRQILKETEEQQPDSAGALEHTADSEKDPHSGLCRQTFKEPHPLSGSLPWCRYPLHHRPGKPERRSGLKAGRRSACFHMALCPGWVKGQTERCGYRL